MREALVILMMLYGFMLCINGAFWWIGNSLGIEFAQGQAMNFTELNQTYTEMGEDFESGGGFNVAFIFGDFGKGLTMLFDLISGKYILNTLTLVGIDSNLILIVQVMAVGFLGVLAGLYYLTGRG